MKSTIQLIPTVERVTFPLAMCSLALCIAMLLCGFVAHPAFAGPKEEAEAAVAWEIAIRAKHPAKNDQSATAKPDTKPAAKPKIVKRKECHTDLATATKIAEKENRAVVLWIGMQCEDDARTREALNECVHVHIESNGGSITPRIEIPKGNGRSWVIEKSMLPTYSAAFLRELANDGKPSASRSVLGGRETIGDCPGGNCPAITTSPSRAYSPPPVYLPASLPISNANGGNCPGGNCPRR